MTSTIFRVPWPIKLGAKIVLSRVPLPPGFWARVGVFRGGEMDDPAYALRIFDAHLGYASPKGLPPGRTLLELGPGESLATGVIAFTRGMTRSYLVDETARATKDLHFYLALLDRLTGEGCDVADLKKATSVDDLCRRARITYFTDGLDSLRSLPGGSVDYMFSNAVLEHVRRREFLPFLRETRRLLSEEGVASHAVDLRDHLDDSLNNLRFPERLWEADWLAASGFYTNRIRFQEMLSDFRASGFQVSLVEEHRWDRLPTPRSRMTGEFRNLEEENLIVSSFWVVLRGSASPGDRP